MSSPVVVSNQHVNSVLNTVREAIGENRKVILKIAYAPASHSMIGDFTGESFKLVENERGVTGVYLTGFPTAKQIIGKARWLMRVALATAADSGSHEEAELAGKIRVRAGGRLIELGAVQLAFGTTQPQAWKGLLTVRVLRASSSRLYYNTSSDNPISVEQAILEARNRYGDEYFYSREGETRGRWVWRIRRGRYAPGTVWGSNRFNSVLSQGARIIRLDNNRVTFIPEREGHYRLVDPIRPSEDLLGFTLEVTLDTMRLSQVINEDRRRARHAICLALLAVTMVPTVLGLGKAANRGFGRFRVERVEEWSLPAIPGEEGENTDTCLTPRREAYPITARGDGEPALLARLINHDVPDLFNLMILHAEQVTGGSAGGATSWESVAKSQIPKLPIGDLELFNMTIMPESADGQVTTALDLIGVASKKYFWKAFCLGTMSSRCVADERGLYYHTWLLGLPRKGKTRKEYSINNNDIDQILQKIKCSRDNFRIVRIVEKRGTRYVVIDITTGYILDDERRQSFLTAYTLDGKCFRIIGFPSGDLLDLYSGLKYCSVHDDGSTERLSVSTGACISRVINGFGPDKCGQVNLCQHDDDESLRMLLTSAFQNFRTVLEKVRVR